MTDDFITSPRGYDASLAAPKFKKQQEDQSAFHFSDAVIYGAQFGLATVAQFSAGSFNRCNFIFDMCHGYYPRR